MDHDRKRKRNREEKESKDRSKKKSKKSEKKHHHHHHHHRSGSSSSSSSSRPVREIEGFEEISNDDYFKKNTEFQTWLYGSKGKTFDQLSSTDSRKMFQKFVKKWNRGKLPDKFYRGIHETEIDSSFRTKHKWNLSLDKGDRERLMSIRDTVDDETHHKEYKGNTPHSKRYSSSSSSSSSSTSSFISASATSSNMIPVGNTKVKSSETNLDPRLPESWSNKSNRSSSSSSSSSSSRSDQYSLESQQEEKRRERKEKEKEYRSRRKLVEEELAPRADAGSREARIEKRKAEREYRNQKGDSPERGNHDDMMMGGGDDIKARIAARKAAFQKKQEQREQQYQQSKKEYDQKESEKMQAFRDMVASGNFTRL